MYSLRWRVVLWLSALLIAFFAATIFALDRSLSASLERARIDVLDAQLIALMATAEIDDETGDVHVPVPPDRRLESPESGFFGQVRAGDGSLLWRSPSALEVDLPAPPPGQPGVRVQETIPEVGPAGVAQRSLTVVWEFVDGRSEPLQFVVAQSLEPYREQQRGFRMALISWFSGLTLATLAALALILSRVLRPLGTIAHEISEIESGSRSQLSASYPAELSGVARNLNALIGRERGRQQRYRDSLANLAHSLKTPLAAMQSLLPDSRSAEREQALGSEIERMDRLVAYHLKRAASAGGKMPGIRALDPQPLLEDLVDCMRKVFADKDIDFEVVVERQARFYGDEGDFQEIAGNLLDNACKYGARRVRATVRCASRPKAPGGTEFVLSVEDDGPGLDPALAEEALQRGTRLDQSRPGHGIGLSVVADIAETYGGRLEVETSALGGAALVVRLPRDSGWSR